MFICETRNETSDGRQNSREYIGAKPIFELRNKSRQSRITLRQISSQKYIKKLKRKIKRVHRSSTYSPPTLHNPLSWKLPLYHKTHWIERPKQMHVPSLSTPSLSLSSYIKTNPKLILSFIFSQSPHFPSISNRFFFPLFQILFCCYYDENLLLFLLLRLHVIGFFLLRQGITAAGED